MNQDTFSAMVRDGRDIIQILQSIPENKRFLLSVMADVFLSGLSIGEQLAAQEWVRA